VPRLLASGDALPFIEPARRHEAAVAPEGVAERRALGERFAARVGELVAQAPAMLARDALLLPVETHDRDVRARADVVARLEVGRAFERELQRDDPGIGMERVTAALWGEVRK